MKEPQFWSYYFWICVREHFDLDAKRLWQRETSTKNKICEAEDDDNDTNVHLFYRQQKQTPEQVNRRSSISSPHPSRLD